MKPYKKSLKAKTTSYRKEYNIITKYKDPYWEEDVYFYPRFNKGFKCSNRLLMSYQIRMYKTWKHNRNNQWKNEYSRTIIKRRK